jgi:hypothetical protein
LTLAFFFTLVFVVGILLLSYRTADAAVEQIRPLFDLLNTEEKAVLRLMMLTGRSLGTFNVGQLTALENIQQKTGFVTRTFVGPYELNQQVRGPLAILLRSEQ